MPSGWDGAVLLDLLAADVDVDAILDRLLQQGLDAGALADVGRLVRSMASDPTVRDRALLLAERSHVLTERADRGARTSDRLRSRAHRARTADDPPVVGPGGLWRHELVTPLAVVELALETLAVVGDDAVRVHDTLDVARRNVRHAIQLLDGLSNLEDLQAGRVELSWEQVDLVVLVRDVVEDVRGVLSAQHAIHLHVDGDAAVPADSQALRQVVVNLLTNAVKFSPPGARVDVSVSTTATHARVAVRDRGRGLSPRDLERIFRAGERLDAGVPGTGLGLFVARQLVRAHGGDLDVEHPEDGGSRFVVRLPLAPLEWQRSLDRREDADRVRDSRRRRQGETADARDAALDEREGVADQRDATLDDREAAANHRDAALDEREAAADERDGDAGR